METRIRALEASVFSNKRQESPVKNSLDVNIASVESRLQDLLHRINSQVPPTHVSEVETCSKLSHELAPSGLVLNYPTNTSDPSPFVFRKNEVLARYEQFKSALDQLAHIRDFLLISNPNLAKDLQNTSKGGTKQHISLDHIASAPIISTENFVFAADEKNVQRLDDCIQKAISLNHRVLSLVARVDVLMERYSNAIECINAKMILLQDELR